MKPVRTPGLERPRPRSRRSPAPPPSSSRPAQTTHQTPERTLTSRRRRRPRTTRPLHRHRPLRRPTRDLEASRGRLRDDPLLSRRQRQRRAPRLRPRRRRHRSLLGADSQSPFTSVVGGETVATNDGALGRGDLPRRERRLHARTCRRARRRHAAQRRTQPRDVRAHLGRIVYCWGRNEFGQLGRPRSEARLPLPTRSTGSRPWTTSSSATAPHARSLRPTRRSIAGETPPSTSPWMQAAHDVRSSGHRGVPSRR